MNRILVASLLLALFAGGCSRAQKNTSSDSSSNTASQSDSASSGTSRASKDAKSTAAESSAASKDCGKTGGGTNGTAMYLLDVRTAHHDTFDRITFEFQHSGQGSVGMPRFEIATVTPPLTYDGSGRPMEVKGSTFGQVIFHGATGVNLQGDEPDQIYDGPKEMKPNFPTLVEAEQQGDFEATLSWIAGLSYPSCWSAAELNDPIRLAWDFPHKR